MTRYPSLEHLAALTDDVGVIQHATFDVPNRSTGYCTDDVSRALIVAIGAARSEELRPQAEKLALVYLAFLHNAQLPEGKFHNFMSYDRTWLADPGSEDAAGRALWSLGYTMLYTERDGWRRLAGVLMDRALQKFEEHYWLRGRAYGVIGLAHALTFDPHNEERRRILELTAERILLAYTERAHPEWRWFEEKMIYANARLPEALLRAGRVLKSQQLIDVGLESLRFYESVVVEDGMFVPIGSQGWYPRGGVRSRYPQQPIEAAGMVDAALVAHEITGDSHYLALAELAMDWFYGKNSHGAVLVSGGGCRDGIDEHSVNANMGAESTISYLSAAIAVADSKIPETYRRR